MASNCQEKRIDCNQWPKIVKKEDKDRNQRLQDGERKALTAINGSILSEKKALIAINGYILSEKKALIAINGYILSERGR